MDHLDNLKYSSCPDHLRLAIAIHYRYHTGANGVQLRFIQYCAVSVVTEAAVRLVVGRLKGDQ